MALSPASGWCCSSHRWTCSTCVNSFSMLSKNGSLCRCQFLSYKIHYLPSKYLDINFHLFPDLRWISNNNFSSSSVHGFLFTYGFKWLYHRSRHCFPVRSFMLYLSLSFYEIFVQSMTPNSSTSDTMAWSSLYWWYKILIESMISCPSRIIINLFIQTLKKINKLLKNHFLVQIKLARNLFFFYHKA